MELLAIALVALALFETLVVLNINFTKPNFANTKIYRRLEMINRKGSKHTTINIANKLLVYFAVNSNK